MHDECAVELGGGTRVIGTSNENCGEFGTIPVTKLISCNPNLNESKKLSKYILSVACLQALPAVPAYGSAAYVGKMSTFISPINTKLLLRTRFFAKAAASDKLVNKSSPWPPWVKSTVILLERLNLKKTRQHRPMQVTDFRNGVHSLFTKIVKGELPAPAQCRL